MTGELKDVLAGRTEDEEAMCAVCSGGLSVAPNLIVFCERCDIAVHQRCYGVDDIPAGLLALCSFCCCGPGIASVCIEGWQLANRLAIMHVFEAARYFDPVHASLCYRVYMLYSLIVLLCQKALFESEFLNLIRAAWSCMVLNVELALHVGRTTS